jgi:hypothetical protein
MKKIKPPTHLAMSKSRLKSKTVPKKKERKRIMLVTFPNQKINERTFKDQLIHSPCNVKVQVAIPKKKMKLHKKIKPPIYFTMSKSKLKS